MSRDVGIRFSRTEDRSFVKKSGRQNVVRDTAMLVNPRLYGIQNAGMYSCEELAPLQTKPGFGLESIFIKQNKR